MDSNSADFELELAALEDTDFAAEDHEHAVDADRIDGDLQKYLMTDEGMDALSDARTETEAKMALQAPPAPPELPVKTTGAAPTSIEGYLHAVAACPHLVKGHYRLGQAFYNMLHTVRPDLAKQVHGEWTDPFYDDKRIPGFLAFLVERW